MQASLTPATSPHVILRLSKDEMAKAQDDMGSGNPVHE
jgi:hypothetical protein